MLRIYPFAHVPVPLAAIKWFSITIAVVAVIPILLLSTRKPHTTLPTNAEPAGPLPLTLTGGDGRLSVAWDRDAAPIRAGQCGVLWINDGDIQRRVILDVSHLRAGKLFYWPVNKAVRFEIRMSGEVGCRSVATSLPQPAEDPHIRKRRAEKLRPPVVGPEVMRVSENLKENETIQVAEFATQGESQLASTGPGDTLQSSAAVAKPIRSIAIREPPQQPHASVTLEAVAITESRLSRIAGKIPVLRRLHRTREFSPPLPVRDSTPTVPPELRRNMKSEVPVDVRAFIDETGKVVYTEMLSDVTETDRSLATMAVFDARRWEFRPAQLGGRIVPAQVILHYRFSNPLLASRDPR